MTTTTLVPSLRNLVARSGPLGVIAAFYVLALAWLTLSRGALVALHWDRLGDVDGIWRIFLIGLRMDTIVIFQLVTLPTIAYLLLPGTVIRERIVAALLAACAAILVHMELSTPGFIAEFDHRPDRIYYEYLIYPREVFTTLAKTYPLSLLLAAVAVAAAAYGTWRLCRAGMRKGDAWSWTRRALAFPLVLLVLAVGIRSSLGHRPANLSTAAFSGNHLANELAVSSTYSLLSAIYMSRKEVDAQQLYGAMDWQEVQRRVRHGMQQPDAGFTSTQLPTLHRQVPATHPARPPNVVVLVLESFGADYVGSLGGLPLSPNLDKWSKQGLWFTDMYATGTRTVRGLEAIATGFPPTAAPSVLKLPNAQHGFFTLGQLLHSQGYATEFIYGGESNFDNMGSFFLDNGFDRIIEQKDFVHPSLLGTWGVADEDLVDKAHATFLAHGDKPFFALLLSTSNHVPFEFPGGRIDLYEQPAATRNNAVKYTDFAIGRFFDLARASPYWDNTIFLVVADHDARVFGADLVPVEHFHVPALMVGPGVSKAAYTKVASQIDLAPTLLGRLGLPVEHPMIGRDLLALPDAVAGMATMQYGDANAFRVGDKVAILAPHQPARTFAYRDRRLVAADHDRELERDALAHLLWADRSYREHLYQMRAESQATTNPGAH